MKKNRVSPSILVVFSALLVQRLFSFQFCFCYSLFVVLFASSFSMKLDALCVCCLFLFENTTLD